MTDKNKTPGVTIKKGTKFTPEEEKAIDKNKVAILLSRPPQSDEVEAQAGYVGVVQCPYCGVVGTAHLDTNVYVGVWCGSCGRVFRA